MKQRYHLFRRENGIYYSLDVDTGKRESLQTTDVEEGRRLLNTKNEACRQPAMNLQIARVYLSHSDPSYSTRTWQHVMDEMARQKKGETQKRWERAMKEKPFDLIRNKVIIETKSQDFLDVLATGTVCTNIFLRRLHNYALDMEWLAKAIIPRRQWPKIEFKSKRAITFAEHQKIICGERNPEWRAYYEILWQLGGSQSDVAGLKADDVDWQTKVISFYRMKTGSIVQLHFGSEVERIINNLPGEGFIFPSLAKRHEKDRAKQFMRRCNLVGVKGVSLHSYRYAWAERAREAGYPERFAQEALGHKSVAVHRAYARKAKVRIPSLEEYERKTIDLFGPFTPAETITLSRKH
jgi:integrase